MDITTGQAMKISVIIPIYEGAKNIARLVDDLVNNLGGNGLEIVLVNDGSRDNSHQVCISIFEKYKNIVKYISLARNFGEHNAVLAGLNNVTGDYAVIIDDDFQNLPEEIPKLMNEAVTGKYDVVYGYYEKKYHHWFRNLGSQFNNFIANCLLNKPRDLYLSSFKCLNRFIIQEVIKYKGPFPYIDGLILRSTQNIGKTLVQHAKRKTGKSGYTLRKLIGLWLNMFTNFSIYPLRVSAFLGFFFLILGVISSICIIVEKFINPDIPVGAASILVAILIFGGIQLSILGLIGEYLGKLFLTNNQAPQYVIRHIFSNDVKGNII
jgi:undecaprenyl-phosphate 4-deoxy-4-formamido-L-arabinose transferase